MKQLSLPMQSYFWTLITILALYLIVAATIGFRSLRSYLQQKRKAKSPAAIKTVSLPPPLSQVGPNDLIIYEKEIHSAFYQYTYQVDRTDLKEMVRFYIRKNYSDKKWMWIKLDRKFRRFMRMAYRDNLVEGQYLKLSPEACKRLLEQILHIQL